MKKNILTIIFSLISFILLLSSCEGTWIMYDTSQKDHLYMENLPSAPVVSFALVADQELTHDVKVKMMGMPVEQDRQFTVEYLEPSASAYLSGETSVEIYITAGSHMLKRVMPRGKGSANRILKRTSHITLAVAEKE